MIEIFNVPRASTRKERYDFRPPCSEPRSHQHRWMKSLRKTMQEEEEGEAKLLLRSVSERK